MGRLDSIKGKMGPRVKLLLFLLLPIGAFGLLLFIMHRVERPPTYLETMLLAILGIYASGVIGWVSSQKSAHERARTAAIRAVRLIQNTEKDAVALYDKALEERGQVSKELENYPESKKVVDRCFDWLIYSLERLRGRISDGRDDWRDFLPEEFEQQRELQAEENELRAERDASAAQLQEMLRVETSKGKQVRDLAEKLENLEERLGVIEATPSPITGAPREAPVPDAVYWFRRGLRYSARGQYEEAIDAYDKAIQLKEDLSEAWNNKGNALTQLGRLEKKPELFHKAIECYDKALGLTDYKDAEAWNNKGIALDELKRYEDAIQCYDKALKLRKDYPEAWNNKGAALYELKRYQEAIECYDKALELRKDYPAALSNKGAALGELGRVEKKPELFQEAIECYDKALELRKDFPEALNNKGNAFAALGRVEKKPELFHEAIECFDKALELTDNKDPDAWYNKACAFALLEQKQNMLEALKEAVRLDAEYKDKAKKDEDFKAYWEDEDFKAVVK